MESLLSIYELCDKFVDLFLESFGNNRKRDSTKMMERGRTDFVIAPFNYSSKFERLFIGIAFILYFSNLRYNPDGKKMFSWNQTF